MTMIELVDKDTKTTIVTIFYTLCKEARGRLNMLKRNMGEKRKQVKLLDSKTTILRIKITLDGINAD